MQPYLWVINLTKKLLMYGFYVFFPFQRRERMLWKTGGDVAVVSVQKKEKKRKKSANKTRKTLFQNLASFFIISDAFFFLYIVFVFLLRVFYGQSLFCVKSCSGRWKSSGKENAYINSSLKIVLGTRKKMEIYSWRTVLRNIEYTTFSTSLLLYS